MTASKNEITAGYLSRVQIVKQFKISESSLSNYQRDYPDFPRCISQHVSHVNRAVATFKTVEIVAWFKKKDAMLKASKLASRGIDLKLGRQFLKHLDSIHFTHGEIRV